MEKDQEVSLFQAIENAFNDAVVSNDTSEIEKFVSNDWVMIDAPGGIIKKQQFYKAIERGQLSHQAMRKEVIRVKIYGDIALVTGRGQNTATWQGQQLEFDEWITDVYRKESDQWRCVLTHLTPVKR